VEVDRAKPQADDSTMTAIEQTKQRITELKDRITKYEKFHG
jgi:hypothetical protein